jgi:hypothetical protein
MSRRVLERRKRCDIHIFQLFTANEFAYVSQNCSDWPQWSIVQRRESQ